MNCPWCGKPMESGRIATQAVFRLLRWPAHIVFEPDDFWVGSKTSSPFAHREGWYCPSCNKIVGVFDGGK